MTEVEIVEWLHRHAPAVRLQGCDLQARGFDHVRPEKDGFLHV